MLKKQLKAICIIVIAVSLFLSQTVYAESSDMAITDAEYIKSITEMIKENYNGEVTDKQLMEGTLKGIFSTMDPYTVFYTSEEAESFTSQLEGSFVGVGMQLDILGEDLVVTKVYSASPAEKAGIVAGDIIKEVDGKNISGMTAEAVASKIRGESGSKVVIGIVNENSNGIKKVEVTRDTVIVNPVTYEIRNDIGYIKLDIFNSNASNFMTKALAEMDKNKIKKIVLDLRNNPGGDVSQAVAIAKKFVPKGLITKLDFKSENVEDEEYYSDLQERTFKLAVLVNENSASASEIVAGAIQDTKAGVLVGTKTFGKAKVQSVIPLLTPEASAKYEKETGKKLLNAYELVYSYGIVPAQDEIIGMVKMTTGQYTTPNGRMIDKVGLTPDIKVKNYESVNGIDVNQIQKLTVKVKPKLGSEGIDVYNAEKILKACKYDIGTPDMKLDAKTFNAIKKFQKESKLFSYGVLDFATQKALNSRLDKLVLEVDTQYAKAVESLNK